MQFLGLMGKALKVYKINIPIFVRVEDAKMTYDVNWSSNIYDEHI
jgi:hypothetical protein